jgi:hypothetical protein
MRPTRMMPHLYTTGPTRMMSRAIGPTKMMGPTKMISLTRMIVKTIKIQTSQTVNLFIPASRIIEVYLIMLLITPLVFALTLICVSLRRLITGTVASTKELIIRNRSAIRL